MEQKGEAEIHIYFILYPFDHSISHITLIDGTNESAFHLDILLYSCPRTYLMTEDLSVNPPVHRNLSPIPQIAAGLPCSRWVVC